MAAPASDTVFVYCIQNYPNATIYKLAMDANISADALLMGLSSTGALMAMGSSVLFLLLFSALCDMLRLVSAPACTLLARSN